MKKITSQTRRQISILLKQNFDTKSLQRLKKARYMRQDYSQHKKRFTVAVNKTDSNKISRHAKALGIPPTTLLRKAAFAYLDNARLPSAEAKNQTAALIYEIRSIGTNLNQLTKHCNTYQKVTLGEFLHARELLKNLEAVAEKMI